MEGSPIRQIVKDAFDAWMTGRAYVTEIFADAMQWEIVGHSVASKQYTSKQQFIDEVLHPFGARFRKDAPFRPVRIRGIYVDGNTSIVLWDGEGTTLNGTPYKNTYAWFMAFQDGLVVNATAFYDSISFNELWGQVQPQSQP